MGDSSIFKFSLILIRFGETLLEWKIEILCHKREDKGDREGIPHTHPIP